MNLPAVQPDAEVPQPSKVLRDRYRPQLDGLRAFAIALVLYQHLFATGFAAPIGYWGVELFFVLSGFLITGILLRERSSIAVGKVNRSTVLKRFFTSRFLRIFPTYYLTLLFAVAAGLGLTLPQLPWFALYAGNFYMFRFGLTGSTTPLWSLAVEEQFYLVWPLLILFAPTKRLPLIIGTLIATGTLFRHVMLQPQAWYLPFVCVDALATGAGVALARDRNVPHMRRWLYTAGIIGGAALTLSLAFGGGSRLAESAVILIAAWLVGVADDGFRGLPGAILELGAVRYTGEISYGIYLFHNLIPEALMKNAEWYNLPRPGSVAVGATATVLAFALAAASWHFIERPLKRARHRFFAPPKPS